MFGRSAMMFGRSARALSSGSFSFSSGRGGFSSYADTMDLMNKLSKIPKVDGDLYAALRVREAIKESIKEEGPKAAPCSVAGSAPGCLLSFSNASKNLELFNKLRDIPNLLEIDLLTTLKVMRVITEAKEAALQKEAAHSSPEVKPSILKIFVAYLTGWTEGDLYKAYNLIMVLGATALSVMGGTVWFCRCIGLFPPSFSEVKEYYEAKGVQISDNNLRQRRREMMNENEKYKLYFLGEWIWEWILNAAVEVVEAGKNWITDVAVSAKKFQDEIPKQIAKILISKRPIADSYLPSFEGLSAQDLDLSGLRYLAHL